MTGHDGRTRLLVVRVTTAAVVVGALVTTTYGVIVAAQPKVVDRPVTLPRLPRSSTDSESHSCRIYMSVRLAVSGSRDGSSIW